MLARWSGWGAVPEVFDPGRADYQWAREQLAGLLSPQEMAAAARNTLNAHYTDAAIVQAVWGAARDLGFTGGRVLEPGCGSGNFIAFAPDTGLCTYGGCFEEAVNSLAEVMRRALAVYEYLWLEKKRLGRVVLKGSEGETDRELVLM